MKAIYKIAENENKKMYFGRMTSGSRTVFTTTSNIDVPEVDWDDMDTDDGQEVENLVNIEVHSLCELTNWILYESKESSNDDDEGVKLSIVGYLATLFEGEELDMAEIEEYVPNFNIERANIFFQTIKEFKMKNLKTNTVAELQEQRVELRKEYENAHNPRDEKKLEELSTKLSILEIKIKYAYGLELFQNKKGYQELYLNDHYDAKLIQRQNGKWYFGNEEKNTFFTEDYDTPERAIEVAAIRSNQYWSFRVK